MSIMENKNDKQKKNNTEEKATLKPNLPYVIICEGKDEYYFLISFLTYLVKNEASFQDCWNVIDFGGINDINQALENLIKYRNYQAMKGFLIVRDAEKDVGAAIASLKDRIKRTWQIELEDSGAIQTAPDGMKVGFFLLPGVDESKRFISGTLEDLCLSIVHDAREPLPAEEILAKGEIYLKHLCKKRGKEMIHPHKNRLHLFFSSTDQFVGDKIGEAAKKGAFDFSNPRLAQLKNLILQMQD